MSCRKDFKKTFLLCFFVCGYLTWILKSRKHFSLGYMHTSLSPVPRSFLDRLLITSTVGGQEERLIGCAFSALTVQKGSWDKTYTGFVPQSSHVVARWLWLWMAGRCFRNIKFINGCKLPAHLGKTKIQSVPFAHESSPSSPLRPAKGVGEKLIFYKISHVIWTFEEYHNDRVIPAKLILAHRTREVPKGLVTHPWAHS